MSRRTLLNAGLAVLVAVLAAVVYLRPGKRPRKAHKPAITRLVPKQVTTLRIRYANQPTVRLVRHKVGWRMTRPWQARASDARVSAVLSHIDERAKATYKASSLKLGKFGLAKPRLRLWLNGTEVDFGTTSPLDGSRYIRVGKRVFVADDALYRRLAARPSVFVSKRLLPPGASITRIALPGLTLTRSNKDQWRARPQPKAAAHGAIQNLVDSWSNVYALSVRRAASGPGKRISGRVSIRLRDHTKPLIFAILGRRQASGLLLARDGWVYRLSASRRRDLLQLKRRSKAGTAAKANGGAQPSSRS